MTSAALKLEVVAETAHREGGHAVLRLKGLDSVPAGTTFCIEPVDDEAGAAPPEGWPSGPLTPIEVRPVDGGLDILIGPDVVDNPRLRAGTPVAITIDTIGLRQELLWPSLNPSISPRRPARVLTMNQSAAMTQALRDAERRQAVVAQIAKAPDSAARDESAAISQTAAAILAATLPPAANGGETRTAGVPGAGLSTLSTSRDRQPPPVEPPAPQPARLQKVEGSTETPRPSAVSDAVSVEVADAPAVGRSYPVVVRDGDGYITDYVARRRSNIALVFGTLALVIASAATGFAYRSAMTGAANPITTASVSSSPDRVALPASTLYDVFKTVDAPDVREKLKAIDREQALGLADTLIHSAGSQRDLKDAEALLRHGLGLSLADKSTLWALTQLGSLAAQSIDGEPDFVRARLLWELSAAHGDPVAMCFLGELHENGLGVPSSKPTARKWYLQAKQAGGCRTVDAALARLK